MAACGDVLDQPRGRRCLAGLLSSNFSFFSGGVAFTVAFFSPLCCSLRILAVVEVMKFGWSERVLLLGAQTAFSLGEAALEVGFMSGLLVLYELSVKRV